MATSTIQLDRRVKSALDRMKLHPRETYNDVLERVLEDLTELDKKTLAEVEEARAEVKAGKFLTHDQVRQALGL